MRFAVFADVHLDTVFRWANPQLARRRRQDVRETLSRIIDRAVEAKVDAILCAGDLYEHEYVTTDTARFIQAAFERAKPIRVFIAPGNHDWFGPQSLYARLEWSSNVHIFREATLVPVELQGGFTIWGAAHRAPANTDGFLSSFRIDRSGVNVALFHGSERGSLHIQEEGKQPHAPFDEQEVERAGLSHVFVGHFHKPRDAARHTYPGNPEPLAFGEEARSGLVIAEIDSSGILERRRIDVHTLTMSVLDMDISDSTNSFDVRERARELLRDAQGIVRLVLRGEIQPDLDLRLEDLSDLTRDGLTVLPLAAGVTVAYDIERIAAEKTVRGEFVRQIIQSQMTEDQRRRVIITGLRAFAGRDDLEVI